MRYIASVSLFLRIARIADCSSIIGILSIQFCLCIGSHGLKIASIDAFSSILLGLGVIQFLLKKNGYNMSLELVLFYGIRKGFRYVNHRKELVVIYYV
jgi:TctA family transporter